MAQTEPQRAAEAVERFKMTLFMAPSAFSQALERPPVVSMRDVGACFERDADATVDAVGRPLPGPVEGIPEVEPSLSGGGRLAQGQGRQTK
ncbi:MAG: hypothetical protein COV48_08215 [Elusimicrobia bacterium CG11_big_fil_rev_8_21_14_0_20_64_6]|nr:MAG: hypothetical protein COV48_08215 [Elusimicrobia bacterium CG11_big_fil_rev_8_21_14_0_20_64_6]